MGLNTNINIPFFPIDIPCGNGYSNQSFGPELPLLSLLLPFDKLALVLMLVLDLPRVEILVGVNGSCIPIPNAAFVVAADVDG